MKANSLTEPTFYILLALASEPLHGYGIIKKVELLSENKIILAAGTLYGALDSLKKSYLVDQISNQDNSRRKVYQITDTGLEVLKNDYLRMKNLCLIAENILMKGEK
ncbi:PadR family transcriptional regulator [Clostridium paraputrificum]|uniref:PadR family transcriptional regulator n=1 Tax=Clostridium paraputrificum TaxID=29363 RepID=UPI001897154E|nr:PadR family transcriptional regulator [Clostridium paraputrificum]